MGPLLQDVIVTGFPTGALGVWLVSHVNDKGVPADPRSKKIVKWNASLIQRISDAHQPGGGGGGGRRDSVELTRLHTWRLGTAPGGFKI